MTMFAQRLAQVSASATLKVAAEAERLRRAGYSVVDFSAGEPDFPTPEHVKAAGKAAIDADFTRYTVSAGIPELREAICARYRRDYGVDITPAEVLMTVGGKQALFNTAMALFDPGDEVVTHAPYWPTIPGTGEADGRDAGDRAHAISDEVRRTCRGRTVRAHAAHEGHHPQLAVPIRPGRSLTKARSLPSPTRPRPGIWVIADLCYEQLIYERWRTTCRRCSSNGIATARCWPVRRRRAMR
jgi:aspartate aminotransferase